MSNFENSYMEGLLSYRCNLCMKGRCAKKMVPRITMQTDVNTFPFRTVTKVVFNCPECVNDCGCVKKPKSNPTRA